ncbi:MAG: CoB--CoM heterodisulfide reductase iron-sulfur subunit B family protein [Desulfarculaceae bacterium]|nr:CoB--CoM heterodisulfide reductase iron-sulfur subunit B family protein [Desulfarculaceae bacterium]MCF8072310.1 CoB--CoM heterodisulfide reductase iron-sulfur subunit B family protein [Desulfarculaceae bacterium]MCF8100231.1 CoB--CoM heterodisulfide reductase iron-sulfur subunit B family protein [Desulfarculaceae bacterium]MCF8116196.1 CoB--CoM heterodisulfide reductase iron-sulfur subunit B family protein [Desulfarculaceae bacterium]
MMSYALFVGCQIPECVPQYETAARKVLGAIDVEVADLEFNCCGYPMRDTSFESYLLASARNMALAESKGLNLLTLCKCCLGSLKAAQNFLFQHKNLRTLVNDILGREGLVYSGSCQVKHLQSMLYHDLGPEKISDLVKRPFAGLKVAPFYGCHALRPSRVTGFDNPYDPHIIDDLLKAIGIESLPWDGRLKCCGAPLRDKNQDLSLETIQTRIAEANRAEAQVLGVDCPHTFKQMQWAFETLGGEGLGELRGVAVYPQLLGLALGLDPRGLGLDENRPRSGCVANFLAPEHPLPPKEEPKAKPKPKAKAKPKAEKAADKAKDAA